KHEIYCGKPSCSIRTVCVDGENRISKFHVHIIHHILCHTNLDVKEAAISCMLSKRWYYCWTSRPNLIFDQFQGNKYMPLENYVKLKWILTWILRLNWRCPTAKSYRKKPIYQNSKSTVL
ncbi:hypothetical protein H5410_062556, partial [Solanum commersonii]